MCVFAIYRLSDGTKTGAVSENPPDIHMDRNLTSETYLNIAAGKLHPFMTIVFPSGIVDCLCRIMHVEEFIDLLWSPESQDLNPSVRLPDVLHQQA